MRYTIEQEGTLTPRAGFTYFGQFIGHDLSHDPTALANAHTDVERITNYRTPYLNLEQLYGGGPAQSPHLYEGDEGAERFKIGTTKEGNYQRDLPIEGGVIIIADERNLDNLILRQLHAVFLRFHNEAINQLSTSVPTILEESDNVGSIFQRAQRIVQWHYQWIIRHDFLPRILHHSFWFRHQGKPDENEESSVPVEFSLAAYRFGHSMVRAAYGLNCRRRRVEIAELMRLGHEPKPVSEDYLIEWGRFFDGLPRSAPVASSAYLDTSLTSAMHDLPSNIVRLCINHEAKNSPTNLPARTLLRGARTWLPSGQQVGITLTKRGFVAKNELLTEQQLIQDQYNRTGKLLEDLELKRNTPLFYYILKEAEILAGGRTLGPVGSYIVGRVILNALNSDPDGCVSRLGHHWRPLTWRFPTGAFDKVDSLIDVIRLVGDHQLLPECHEKWLSLQPIQRTS